jgi:hypothetical protein
MKQPNKTRFSTNDEAEDIAVNLIEAYVNDCKCSSQPELQLASQKLLRVAISFFETANGYPDGSDFDWAGVLQKYLMAHPPKPL